MGQKLGKESIAQKFRRPDIPDAETVLVPGAAISCPVCYDVFHKTPAVFPCGHSLCVGCLKRLWNTGSNPRGGVQKIECPLCRRPCIYPGLSAIPANFVLGEVLEGLKEIASDQEYPLRDGNLLLELEMARKDVKESKKEVKELEGLLDAKTQQSYYRGCLLIAFAGLWLLSKLV